MNLGLKDKVVLCMASAAGLGKGIAMEAAREGAGQHVYGPQTRPLRLF